MEWEEVSLGEVIATNSKNIGKDYTFSSINYYDISSIDTGLKKEPTYYKIENIPSRAKRIIEDNDIIISTVRPVHRSFYFCKNTKKNDVVSTGFAVLSANEEFINSRFLYYIISSQNFTNYLVSNEQGATYPAITPDIIKKAKIKLPPLKTQKKIASILSNYDNLIENNNQRIKLLESMAEEIYKEWFVRLRFPEFEKVKNITIGELVDLRQGFALNSKSKHYISDKGGIPLLKISDLFNGTETLFVDTSIPKQFLVYEHEIIYTRTAQVGYVFMGKKGVIYNNCFKVIPKNILYTKFIYYFLKLKSTRNFAQTLATGTAQADLNHDSFKSIRINYPIEEIIIKFNKIVEPLDKEIEILLDKNKTLKETRDLLLPKLINGTLKVE